MNRVAIWPFAVRMDSFGTMIDAFQSIYSRGLCRAFAEGLLRTRSCEVAVCLPIVTIGDVVSWSVMGKSWTVNEGLEVQPPEGTKFLILGDMSFTENLVLRCLLISLTEKRPILDRQFCYPRAQIPNCLSEPVTLLAEAIAGRFLTKEETQHVEDWGTSNSNAYLAYLEAWSAAAAFRFGVSVSNPQAAFEYAVKAVRIDPSFVAARMLKDELGSVGKSVKANEPIGYSEFAYPILINGKHPN